VTRLDAAHPRGDERVRDDVVDLLGGHPVEVHRDGGREHLDVAGLLGAVCSSMSRYFLGPARSPGLEEVLVHHPHLPLRAADRPLQHATEDWIRLVDTNGVRKLLVM